MKLVVFLLAAALLFAFGFHAMWEGGWFGTPIMGLTVVMVAARVVERRRLVPANR